MKNMKHFSKRGLALLLTLLMCLSMMNLTVFAAEETDSVDTAVSDVEIKTPDTAIPSDEGDGADSSSEAADTQVEASADSSVIPETSEDSSTDPETSEDSSVAPETSEDSSAAPETSADSSVAPEASEDSSAAPETSADSSVAPEASEDSSAAPVTPGEVAENTAPAVTQPIVDEVQQVVSDDLLDTDITPAADEIEDAECTCEYLCAWFWGKYINVNEDCPVCNHATEEELDPYTYDPAHPEDFVCKGHQAVIPGKDATCTHNAVYSGGSMWESWFPGGGSEALIPASCQYPATAAEAIECMDCGAKWLWKFNESSQPDPTAHAYTQKWGEPYPDEVIEATCTEDGSKTYTCKLCGDNKVEVIPSNGHQYTGDVAIVEATCLKDGSKTGFCSACNAEVTEVIPAGGHQQPEEGVETVEPTCTEDGSETYACTLCGEIVTESIPADGHVWDNHVCEACGTVDVRAAGAYMAYWYGYVPSTSKDLSKNVSLNDLVGAPLTMESFQFDTSDGKWAEYVTNYSSQKVWQCVGFIPFTGDVFGDSGELTSHVYTDLRKPGKFTAGSLEDAKQLIADKGGLLYGETLTEETAANWKAEFTSSKSYNKALLAVWFVADTDIHPGDYGVYKLTIDPVVLPKLRENSEGIEVGCDLDKVEYVPQSNGQPGHYNIDIVVTIGENAPLDAHVNLVPALVAAMEKIDRTEGFEPGDQMIISLSIDNQSGRDYTYDEQSGFIATNPSEVEGKYPISGVGFDGFQIPAVEDSDFADIARRTNNTPVKELLGQNRLTSADITDAKVGAKLKELGYGEGEELSDEQIAQTYLASYYLDWTNAARETKGEAPASSFEDLSIRELAVFSNGDNNVHVFESCQPAAEALYYFYYARIFTYNGESIYTHMQKYGTNLSELETAIPAALVGSPYVLNVANIAGEEANNGFQNTKFGFRLEFDLVGTETPETPEIPETPDNPGPSSSTTSLTVNKVWVGDDEASRPESVRVQLYRDGEAYGSPVTLRESNGWSHTWRGLNDRYSWTAEEIDVPDGYTSSASQSGTVVTITNTYVQQPPEEPPVDIPDEEPPLTEIPDEEPPLAEIPEEEVPLVEIPEEEVPLSNVPKTGDKTGLWLTLALGSAFALICTMLRRKEQD